MMPYLFKIILPTFLLLYSFGNADENTSITTSITLKVDDRNSAGKFLMEQSEVLGGYFLNSHENFIVFKIDNQKVDSFLKICDSVGNVIDRNYQSFDHSNEMIQKNARLKAKRKLLADYFALLNQAEMGSVLAVERAIVGLQTEIESLMADLKLLEHRIFKAEVTVYFQFSDRKAPLRDGSSEFEWLNSLNLYDLNRDFQYGLK